MTRSLVLMCGAGGATKGLEAAGWEPAVSVDYWEPACLAHRKWMPAGDVLRADVREVHRMLRGPFPFIWASPSCKPWSTANRTPSRGKAHREYYSLAFLVEQAFDRLGARWLVIENVGGLVWSKEGRVELGEFAAAVAARGLKLSMPKGGGTIASNTMGVAQLRRRVFLVVGPAYVSIRPGVELIPPAGVPPMLWETAETEAQVVGGKSNGRESWGRAERMVGGTDHERGKASVARTAASAMASEGSKGTLANPFRRASTAAILKDDHPQKWAPAYRYGERAQRGVVDASLPSRHANWTGVEPLRAGAGVVADEWGRVNGAKRLRATRAIEAGEHAGRKTGRRKPGDDYTQTGRSLAECCALQQIPAWVVEGFSKRVAHELVGNAVPPPVAEHIGRIILAADAALGVA